MGEYIQMVNEYRSFHDYMHESIDGAGKVVTGTFSLSLIKPGTLVLT